MLRMPSAVTSESVSVISTVFWRSQSESFVFIARAAISIISVVIDSTAPCWQAAVVSAQLPVVTLLSLSLARTLAGLSILSLLIQDRP